MLLYAAEFVSFSAHVQQQILLTEAGEVEEELWFYCDYSNTQPVLAQSKGGIRKAEEENNMA